MKRLLLLLPVILVACGSQLVEFPEDTAAPPAEEPCDCPPAPVEQCTNGVDDDGDGLVDCADPDCDNDQACATFVLTPPEKIGTPPAEDSGPPEEDAGPQEDAGSPQEDAGEPGDLCSSDAPKTCEDKLHCCMNACKPLVQGGSQHDHNEHVSCVQNCANEHKVCVKTRQCSKKHH
jgi:hypothetical protein